jgi:cell division protein FtsI (penicillin-binding protein 3)
VFILAALFASAFAGLVLRLTYLQVVRHEALRAAAERQYAKTVTITPKRGPILDRHGVTLADSSAAESLFVQPRRVVDPEAVANRVATVLGVSPGEIRRRIESDRPFVWLRRRLPPGVARSLRELDSQGLGVVPDTIRVYPNRELAAHVLGFEGIDGVGLEGIERVWNAHLAGGPGKALVERDALGRDVTWAPAMIKRPRPGAGLSLTLDTTIQFLVEREIDAAYRRTESKAAMAIVADPRTGEVLALAVRPTFNPNTFTSASGTELRNRAISDPFEPGSTFKVILAAAALEEHVVKPTDTIHAGNGSIKIANTTIRDWKKYGWLTFAEVLENSSNIGSIKVGLALGRDRYHRYITDFGFGSQTGVGLPGESRGVVREPRRWSGLSLATLSIGQEISVTGLQLVAAFAAVANGGRLMQPRLVRALLDAEGRDSQVFAPSAVRQVISPDTARTLTRLLVQVVENGTGHAAMIPGYQVGGKTGTAQKLDPMARRYSHAPGVLSFVGFAPADDPRLVMLVLLDEPKNERWGSEAAAPIFSVIGAEVLRHLGVPPTGIPPLPLMARRPGNRTHDARLGREALTQPRKADGLDPRIGRRESNAPGRGEESGASLGTRPNPGALGGWARREPERDPSDDRPRDEPHTGEAFNAEAFEAVLAMPAVAGMTLRHALAVLAERKIEVMIRGRGIVVNQVPLPGDMIHPDTVAHLELAPR